MIQAEVKIYKVDPHMLLSMLACTGKTSFTLGGGSECITLTVVYDEENAYIVETRIKGGLPKATPDDVRERDAQVNKLGALKRKEVLEKLKAVPL